MNRGRYVSKRKRRGAVPRNSQHPAKVHSLDKAIADYVSNPDVGVILALGDGGCLLTREQVVDGRFASLVAPGDFGGALVHDFLHAAAVTRNCALVLFQARQRTSELVFGTTDDIRDTCVGDQLLNGAAVVGYPRRFNGDVTTHSMRRPWRPVGQDAGKLVDQ